MFERLAQKQTIIMNGGLVVQYQVSIH